MNYAPTTAPLIQFDFSHDERLPLLHLTVLGLCVAYCTNPDGEGMAVAGRITQLIKEEGADVDAVDYQGRTALYMECERVLIREEVVLCLIEHGADVNKAGIHGRTPLRPQDVQKLFAAIACLAGGTGGADNRLARVSGETKLPILGKDALKQNQSVLFTTVSEWYRGLGDTLGSAILSKMQSNFQKGQTINPAIANTLNELDAVRIYYGNNKTDIPIMSIIPRECWKPILCKLSLLDIKNTRTAFYSFFKNTLPANSDHVEKDESVAFVKS